MIRLTGDAQVTTTTKAADDASKRISRYLFMQLLINTAFGVIITVGLLAIGVDYALLWGFLASLMRYVPYIGTWLGLIPPAGRSRCAMSDGWWQPITVLALYVGLEVICNNVFEPWLYGTSMGLSEVAQLVAAAFWAFLWGPIGLILSGPLTVCLLVLGKYVPRFQFLEVLLGDEPALGAGRAAFYQRLTARDQDEATEVAREELKKSSAEEVFDDGADPGPDLRQAGRRSGRSVSGRAARHPGVHARDHRRRDRAAAHSRGRARATTSRGRRRCGYCACPAVTRRTRSPWRCSRGFSTRPSGKLRSRRLSG